MYVAKTLDEACENGLQKVEGGGGRMMCLYCSTTWAGVSHGRRHIEAKHFQSGGYICDICQAYCRTKHALTCHQTRHHRT